MPWPAPVTIAILSGKSSGHRAHQSTTVPSGSTAARRVLRPPADTGWRAATVSSISMPRPGCSGTPQCPSCELSAGRAAPRRTTAPRPTSPPGSRNSASRRRNARRRRWRAGRAGCAARCPRRRSRPWPRSCAPRQAADMADVGLGDSERAQAEQIVELGAIHQPLAGCDRARRARLHLLHRQRVAGLHRLLDEQRTRGRQRGDVLQRRARRGRAAVEIDHDLTSRRPPPRAGPPSNGHGIDLARRGGVVRVGNVDDLYRAYSRVATTASPRSTNACGVAASRRPRSSRPCRDGCRRRRGRASCPPSRRHTGRPTLLPKMSHSATSMPLIAVLPITPMRQKPCLFITPHELLDVARVVPDHQRFEVLHRADHGARLPFQRRLAPAEQAGLVGVHAHEHPVPHRGVDDERAQAGDLHAVRPSRAPPPARFIGSLTQIII